MQRDHGALDPDAEGGGSYLHDFATLDEARRVIGEFIERYNRAWLLERHDPRGPHAAGGVIKPPTCPENRDLYASVFDRPHSSRTLHPAQFANSREDSQMFRAQCPCT
jgi:hypothetical protein